MVFGRTGEGWMIVAIDMVGCGSGEAPQSPI